MTPRAFGWWLTGAYGLGSTTFLIIAPLHWSQITYVLVIIVQVFALRLLFDLSRCER